MSIDLQVKRRDLFQVNANSIRERNPLEICEYCISRDVEANELPCRECFYNPYTDKEIALMNNKKKKGN